MAINFNQAPYYDDFSETKGFYKTLFRPGYAIQARELNQIQTALQTQVSRVGDHLFKPGTVVIPGNYDVQKCYYVELEDTLVGITTVQSLVGKILYCGSTSGSKLEVICADDKAGASPHTLYIRSIAASNEATPVTRGKVGQKIYIQDYDSNGDPLALVEAGTIAATSNEKDTYKSWIATIAEGIYYVNGYFVKVFKQAIGVSKTPDSTNLRVGLDVLETIVTDTTDSSLLDPALGSSNELAPGAHRYKIELKLNTYNLTEVPPNDFIELTRITGGLPSPVKQTTQYGEIMKTFARRAYETNGNFTIKPFAFKIKPWYRYNNNNGLYTAADIYAQYGATTDPEKAAAIADAKLRFGVEVNANKAYINGFECYVYDNTILKANRARTTKQVTNGVSLFNSGNYFYVCNMKDAPDVDKGVIVELRDAPITTPGTAAGEIIGYARVRSVGFHSGVSPQDTASAVYKIYVYDVRLNTGKTEGDIGSFNVPTNGSSPCNGTVLQSYYVLNNTGQFTTNADIYGSAPGSGVKSFRWDLSTKRLWATKEGPIGTITITNGGTGYTDGATQTVTFTGGGGSGAAATANVVGGVVQSITISNYGDGYTSAPTISVPGAGSGLAATITIAWETPLEEGDTVTQTGTSITAIVSQRTIINKNETASQLIRLPSEWVYRIKDANGVDQTTYTVQRTQSIVLNGSGIGTYTVGTNETLAPISSTSYFVHVSSGAALGSIRDTANLSIDGTLKTLTFTDASIAGQTITVFIPVVVSVASVGAKTITTTSINVATPTTKIPLGFVDAMDLLNVYDSGNPANAATTSDPSVKESYRLVRNQNSTEYNGSYIELLPGKRAPKGQLLISFRYFAQGTGDIYTVDSYVSLGGEYHAEIPALDGNVSSKTELRDHIDSRNSTYSDFGVYTASYTSGSATLTLTNGGTTNLISTGATIAIIGDGIPFGTYVSAKPTGTTLTMSANATKTKSNVTVIVGARITSNIAVSSLAKAPLQNNTTLTYDYAYYLGRVDSVYFNDEGVISIVEGNPDTKPIPGEDRTAANIMKIADISIPPFTPDKTISYVVVSPKEHKRYTMDDITKLERRLENVEVVLTDNMMTQAVEDTQIIDANTGLNRFKSGFFVDTFTTIDSADLGNTEYRASLDTELGEVRPTYHVFPIALTRDSVNSDPALVKWGDAYVVPYTEVSAINQNLASRSVNVNGNSSFNWNGDLTVTPNIETWVDTETLPLITNTVNI